MLQSAWRLRCVGPLISGYAIRAYHYRWNLRIVNQGSDGRSRRSGVTEIGFLTLASRRSS